MSKGRDPWAGESADHAQDLVFVSYSHCDAEWVQRFKVLLSPLLRTKRLRLWTDIDIRTGESWHPDILNAIKRSTTALILVSADFLYSDFIMAEELPALIRHGVRLAPVLVGSCMWDQVPELTGVQWLHDPNRDGPLNLVTHQGERDRRLLETCNRLVKVAPIPGPERAVDRSAPPVAVQVAELQPGTVLGALHDVPQLPHEYVTRDEFRALIEAVVSGQSGAIGLTGQAQTLGLYGQGGIGKSVLAAAVARDDGIRSRFPDGVYWMTVGQKADLLAMQLTLLAKLDDRDAAPRTFAEAAQRLRTVLRDRRVLLVVDDVWSDAAAQAFRVTGPYGRVLYTTRNSAVLTACAATPYQVNVLSPPQARAVAAHVLDIPPDMLPNTADRAFEAVGRVALAVALIAAAVRGGRPWNVVARDLNRYSATYGDHPYANTFKAMHVAVNALTPELADALLGLAVFPPDTQIPEEAVARYWAGLRDTAQTTRDLTTLAEANVLLFEHGTIEFHDLQRDYLLLHAPALALLHSELLNAYRTLLPPDGRDQWWRLPVDEPYIWDHLVTHLRGAGERDTLAETVTNPAYLAHRVAASGTHAAEADLAGAAEALPDNAAVDWWRRWLARHAHLLTGIPGQGEASARDTTLVAPTMLAWLTADQGRPEWVDPEQLSPLLPSSYLKARWGLSPPPKTLIRVLTGHRGSVTVLAWSPDGAHLATASYDQQVRIWDPATGHTQTHHTGPVTALAWSPDGAHLATASSTDPDVRIWDPTTGHTHHTLTGHTQVVTALAWSPDGTHLATASTDQVWIWDPTSGHTHHTFTGHTHHTFTGHTDWVTALAWSPDGTHLATASYDQQVRIWDPTTGRAHHTLTGHTQVVTALAWSADGTRLATASDDHDVRIWDPTTGRAHHTLTGHTDPVTAVAWSPDGTRLATASTDQDVRIWDPTTGHTHHTLTGHTDPVTAGLVTRRHPPRHRQHRPRRADLGPHHRTHPPHPHRPHRPSNRSSLVTRRHPHSQRSHRRHRPCP